MSCCKEEDEKKKKKERKRSGPFEYSLMDLTGKGSLSLSARGRGVIQHSGREEVGTKCLFQPLKLGVLFTLTLSLVGRAGDEGQGRKKQTWQHRIKKMAWQAMYGIHMLVSGRKYRMSGITV